MIAEIKLILIEKDGGLPDDMSVGDSVNIVLDESRRIFIGRAADVDVLVNAPRVGRHVVDLWLEPDGVMVRDLGSGGGSALEVNGVRTERPRRLLPDGATLWIGPVGFRVKISSDNYLNEEPKYEPPDAPYT